MFFCRETLDFHRICRKIARATHGSDTELVAGATTLIVTEATARRY
jgi:hypothetical protein